MKKKIQNMVVYSIFWWFWEHFFQCVCRNRSVFIKWIFRFKWVNFPTISFFVISTVILSLKCRIFRMCLIKKEQSAINGTFLTTSEQLLRICDMVCSSSMTHLICVHDKLSVCVGTCVRACLYKCTCTDEPSGNNFEHWNQIFTLNSLKINENVLGKWIYIDVQYLPPPPLSVNQRDYKQNIPSLSLSIAKLLYHNIQQKQILTYTLG